MLTRYWHIEMTLVMLKRWSPLFEPEKENLGAIPIWVRLSSLSLQFWVEEIFEVIEDDLRVYLDHYRAYQDTVCIALAHILVHLDTREGLVESYFL